jgi:hypothetical protein
VGYLARASNSCRPSGLLLQRVKVQVCARVRSLAS